MRDEERGQKHHVRWNPLSYHFVSWTRINFLVKSWQMHAQTLRLEAMTCVPKCINPASMSTKQNLDIESKQRWLTVDSFGWSITNRNQVIFVILLGFLLFCLTEFSTCPVDTLLIWSFFGPNLETIEIQVLAITRGGIGKGETVGWLKIVHHICSPKKREVHFKLLYIIIWWYMMMVIYLMLESLYYIPARTWQNTNSYQTLNVSAQLQIP